MLTREEALAIYQAGPQTVVPVFLEMDARIHALEQRVEDLQAQVQPLQDQLAQNSRNSSKPPSSDGLHKPSPKSLRQKGQRQSGGQPGHKGHTLKRVEKPDRVEVHRLDACECCGRPLGDQPPEQVEKRQVHDLPPRQRVVTEHQAEIKLCSCGHRNQGAFPVGVNAPVQYGPRARAAAVYLNNSQFLPYERTCQLLDDLFACPMSEGTLANLLAEFRGRALHDFWKPYFAYSCLHGLCNAHHLRELIFVHEQHQQDWADQMIDCLLDIKQAVDQAAPTADRLPEKQIQAWEARYQQILEEGFAHNPLSPRPANAQKKRGRRKKTKPRNLLERLDQHRQEALAFMYDFNVPFDNNLVERDIRMIKVQQKISGTFRSEAGAKAFCTIRSYLSTARKNAVGAIDALARVFSGDPFVPTLDSS